MHSIHVLPLGPLLLAGPSIFLPCVRMGRAFRWKTPTPRVGDVSERFENACGGGRCL